MHMISALLTQNWCSILDVKGIRATIHFRIHTTLDGEITQTSHGTMVQPNSRGKVTQTRSLKRLILTMSTQRRDIFSATVQVEVTKAHHRQIHWKK